VVPQAALLNSGVCTMTTWHHGGVIAIIVISSSSTSSGSKGMNGVKRISTC
jgi:hypothetical protein